MQSVPQHEHPELEVRMPPNGGRLAVLEERTRNIQDQLSGVVTKEEFAPVKMVIYGMVGMILVGVIGGLLTLVLVK